MIARACNTHLIVLYPYRLIDYDHHGDMTTLKRPLEAEAKEKFHLLRSNADLDRVSWEFQPEIGFMADRISARARKKNIDLVIISQQQTEAENDLRSLNLQKLISNSQLPFVIVPAEVNTEANIQNTLK